MTLRKDSEDDARPETVADYSSLAQGDQDLLAGFASLAATVAQCPLAWFSTFQGQEEVPMAAFGGVAHAIPSEVSAGAYVCAGGAALTMRNPTLGIPIALDRPVAFYVGTPVYNQSGEVVGVLAAADAEPRPWSPHQQDAFEKLAEVLARLLRLIREHAVQQKMVRASRAAKRGTGKETPVQTPGEQREPAAPAQSPNREEQLQAINAELQSIAFTDGLTNLANRRALEKVFKEWVETGEDMTLLCIDIDWFKNFNDVHGHVAGDEVLRQVGKILAEESKTSGFPARYGGEEFVILLGGSDVKSALAFAERVRQRIERHSWPLREITVSIGVGVRPADVATLDGLVHRADLALYAAKRMGKNRVLAWTPG